MNGPNETKTFEERLEAYLDGTLTAEDAKALLDELAADETRRDEFCKQVQTARLLEAKSSSSTADVQAAVGKRLRQSTKNNCGWRLFRWPAVLKIAAAFAIVAVAAGMLLPALGPAREKARRVAEASKEKMAQVEKKMSRANQTAKPKPRQGGKELDDGRKGQASPRPEGTVDEIVASAKSKPATSREASRLTTDPVARELTSADTKAPRPVSSTQTGNKREPQPPAAKPAAEGLSRVRVPQKLEERRTRNELLSDRVGARTAASRFAGPAGAQEKERSVLTRPPPGAREDISREHYAEIVENAFKTVREAPLSTFSIDVDTASYANARRFLTSGRLPPKNAVRVEEMINYFSYNYKTPGGEDPFSASMALHPCPWNRAHQLLRIGLQGRELDLDDRKPSNVVFLLDVSGSMNQPDKLPLLKEGMEMLVRNLGENDRVAIVVYAGSSGLVLDSTSTTEQDTIIGAMNRLRAGGSTAGGAGIELAYRVAQDNFIRGGVNRVVLATDGDFNVGVSSQKGLQELIEEKRRSGVFLSVLGFGTGNIQDSKMELLANKGNGNYYYIDSRMEARKVLVQQMNATLVTIAKDVKIQVEFNPHFVRSYRLVGYENRKLAARDFADDTKDAGEIGAGHRVTALYELVPRDAPATFGGVDLKYRQAKADAADEAPADTTEILTLKLRYKQPDGDTSKLLTFPLSREALGKSPIGTDYQWAAAVAAFGQMLRGSQYIRTMAPADVKAMAADAIGDDEGGYRAEFLRLVDRAIPLLSNGEPAPKHDYPVWQYR